MLRDIGERFGEGGGRLMRALFPLPHTVSLVGIAETVSK